MSPDLTEGAHLAAIATAIRAATDMLAMKDAPPIEDDPLSYEQLWEEIFHCEHCIMKAVLDILWPPIDSYIEWLKVGVVRAGEQEPHRTTETA